MTKEEIIKYLNIIKAFFLGSEHHPISDAYFALDEAIKALEQEPVLDKIRAEIEEYKSRQLTWAVGVEDLEKGKQIAIEYVLAIIDKYKTEGEG